MMTDFIKNLTDITSKFAAFAGFDDKKIGSTHGSSGKIRAELEKRNQGAKSLSDLFSYRYFDPQSSLFFNDEGWVSFFMELSPIVGDKDGIITKNLEHFFNDEMPQNSWMQFLLVASNDVTDIIGRWKRSRTSQNAGLKKLEQRREKFLYQMSSDYKNSIGRTARDYKLYLVFSQKNAGIRSELTKFKLFMYNLKQKLDSINLAPTILGVDSLFALVNEIIEVDLEKGKQGIKSRPKRYDHNRTISDQILTPGITHEINDDRIEHKDTGLTSKSYFVSEFPLEFSLNQMIRLLGDGNRDKLSIPARFILSYVVASNLNSAAQGAIVQKGQRAIDTSEQWYSRNNRDIKREADEWKYINDRAKNGEKFLTEFFQIILTAPTDFIDEAEQSLFSLYNMINWRLELNKHFQLPAFLSMLPMQAPLVWAHLTQFKLVRQVLSGEVIAKLPIHAEWKGAREPVMLLTGKNGQVFGWNPFENSSNPHTKIFGPSGSGKSFKVQELLTNLMAQGVKIFVLDIGQSYKNICELVDGEYIQFGKNNKLSLNPFSCFSTNLTGVERDDAIAYAKAIIASMCEATGNSLKEAYIEKAINKGLEIYANDFDITKLAKLLPNIRVEEVSDVKVSNNKVAEDLAMSLYSYTEEGIYGKYFTTKDGLKDAKFDKQITVFEFEEIKSNTLLLATVIQIISMQISMQILTGDRSKRTALCVDEAPVTIQYTAKLFDEYSRTFRKYGAAFIIMSQNYDDLQNGEYQKSISKNCAWTVILKQGEEGANTFKDAELFKNKIPLIKSISKTDNYGEALICKEGLFIIGRLAVDNYTNVLYSTKAEIFKGRNELMSAGKSLDEAVEIIAERLYGSA